MSATVLHFRGTWKGAQPPRQAPQPLQAWKHHKFGDVVVITSVDDGIVSTHDGPSMFGSQSLDTFLNEYAPHEGKPSWWKPSMEKGTAYHG